MVFAVSRFVRTLVDICLLRAGPQDLPYSPNLLVLSLVAYGALGVQMAKLGVPQLNPLLFSAIDIGLLLGFVWFLLSLKGGYSRFNQTALALSGTGVLLGILAWALLSWQSSLVEQNASPTVSSLLLLAHLVWNLAIIANIVRHAMAITMAWAWGVALAYFFIYMAIIRLIAVGVAQGNT